MSKEHAYAYESGYQDGLKCAETDNAKLVAKLRELVLKNWYITLSEREALRKYKCDEAYISSLDEEIGNAKAEMRELGIEG